MNLGMQHEIRRGMVASVDYLRNVSTHNFLILDTNHTGDARFFNKAAAQAAISTTNAQFGCADVTCDIAAGAHITDFASNGLDSGFVLCNGAPCPAAAFPGINTAVGSNEMLFPIGRSVYNALQATVKEDVARPLPGIKHVNLQVSYSFSRYIATARDNDFSTAATDFANPNRYIGPNCSRPHSPDFLWWVCGFACGFPSWIDCSFRQSAALKCASASERLARRDLPD